MSISLEYRDLATPKLKAMLAGLAPGPRQAMLARLGKELAIALKKHFKAREDEGNKRDWPRSHWWNKEVREKTALREATADRAVVGIASAQFRFRATGGTIKPGPGRKFLAIPHRPEVKGVYPRAGTIPGLFYFRSKKTGARGLATAEGGALRVYWWLVPSVTQAADPRALPPVAELRTALQARAEKEVQRVVGGR